MKWAEVQTYSTVATRPEVAKYGDVVGEFGEFAISQRRDWKYRIVRIAVYAYDVRTEILGTKGAIFVGEHRADASGLLEREWEVRRCWRIIF